MLGKTIRARTHQGRIEPVEPVALPTEGTEVVITLEEAALANEWFLKLRGMFSSVRERLRAEPEEAIEERIAQAVKASRAKKD